MGGNKLGGNCLQWELSEKNHLTGIVRGWGGELFGRKYSGSELFRGIFPVNGQNCSSWLVYPQSSCTISYNVKIIVQFTYSFLTYIVNFDKHEFLSVDDKTLSILSNILESKKYCHLGEKVFKNVSIYFMVKMVFYHHKITQSWYLCIMSLLMSSTQW